MKNIFKRVISLMAILAMLLVAAPSAFAVDYLVDAETLNPGNFQSVALADVQYVAAPAGYRIVPNIGMAIAQEIDKVGTITTYLGGYTFVEEGADISSLMRMLQELPEAERDTLFVHEWKYVACDAEDTPRRIVISYDTCALQFYVQDSIDEIDPELVELALKLVVESNQRAQMAAVA